MAWIRCTGNTGGSLKVRTASGAIASFETNIADVLQEVKCEINAKQDLHGYDKPWAAGGVNKLEVGGRVSQTTANVTYTSDDNYIYLNGVKNGGGYADMSNLTITLPAGTYYLKAFPISGTTSNTIDLYAYDGSSDLTGSLLSGERTLTLTEPKTFRFRFAVWTDGAVLSNYKIGIVISTSSGIDKFYPYENFCPIEGYTEANITRCGANLIQKQAGMQLLNLPSGTTIYFRLFNTNINFSLYALPSGMPNVEANWERIGGFIGQTLQTETTTKDYSHIGISASAYSDLGAGDIQISLSSFDTFTPYNGQTYAIAFGQTVYGGVLGVTRGKLHVTWANLTFAELATKSWAVSGSGIFYLYPIATAMPDILLPIVNNPLCSSFAYQPSGTMENNTFRISDALYVKTDEAATVADFKTWLANNTGSFAYELATPIDIDLTPEVISAIVGENNVFADCGETEVKYLAEG